MEEEKKYLSDLSLSGLVKLIDGEKTIAHSNLAEHGICELHVK